MKHTLHLFILTALVFSATFGTAQVTKLSNNTNIEFGLSLGSIGVFVDSSGALWRSDGTAAGTVQFATTLVKVDTGNVFITPILNGKIYFTGINATNGSELWVTDGTDAGTQMVKDIEAASVSSSPVDLFLFNNTIYFFANTTATGYELWKSDGTIAGTVMVKDINLGANSSNEATTFFSNNNILYFTANDGTNGNELWKTDGSSGGTVMVKDISPGGGSSDPGEFTALGNTVIFSADDGTSGPELWKTDGTEAGTVLVKDINTSLPALGSSPSQFLLFNNKLYFTALANSLQITLYSTDGTTAGTVPVKSFGSGYAIISLSVIINNKFYFPASTTINDQELWSSDGTTAGTLLLKDINPSGSSDAFILPDIYAAAVTGGNFHTSLYNGKIFFMANDGTNGNELWVTDGTAVNTVMVKDINPGAVSSMELDSLNDWIYTSSGLFFSAKDGTHGYELWKSDATSGGTTMVQDLNAGSGSSYPFIIMFLANHLYFTGNDGDNTTGLRDLYIIDEAVTLPVTLLNFTATLNGKSVLLQWTTSEEINTKTFVVQRSHDGSNFDNIGTVNAVGNSTEKTSYQFTDVGALNATANKLYYRLQMVDKDGKSAYSKIATINLNSNKQFVIYPNPVKDQLLVSSNSSLSRIEMRITDQNGRIVYKQQLENMQAGSGNKINVANLQKGVYYLQIITGTDTHTTKFFKF
jgi:ELWxxDGT repeat protein